MGACVVVCVIACVRACLSVGVFLRVVCARLPVVCVMCVWLLVRGSASCVWFVLLCAVLVCVGWRLVVVAVLCVAAGWFGLGCLVWLCWCDVCWCVVVCWCGAGRDVVCRVVVCVVCGAVLLGCLCWYVL